MFCSVSVQIKISTSQYLNYTGHIEMAIENFPPGNISTSYPKVEKKFLGFLHLVPSPWNKKDF